MPLTNVTQILELLHTTTAYQAAALQLLCGEADWASQRLGLAQPIPIRIQISQTNNYGFLPLPYGLSGHLIPDTNYHSFGFSTGRLVHVQKYDWYRRTFGEGELNASKLTNFPAGLTTNDAVRLATRSLAALDIDVAALNKQHPVRVSQYVWRDSYVPEETTNAPMPPELLERYGIKSRPMKTTVRDPLKPVTIVTPIIDVWWGAQWPAMAPVHVKLLSHTRELVELSIRDSTFWRRPPAAVSNAAALLGPLPPPGKFLIDFFGGEKSLRTVEAPESVSIQMLPGSSSGELQDFVSGPPRVANKKQVAALSRALTELPNINWLEDKLCSPTYGSKLTFNSAGHRVDILLCFDCDIFEVRHGQFENTANFDNVSDAILALVRESFPHDKSLRKVFARRDRDRSTRHR